MKRITRVLMVLMIASIGVGAKDCSWPSGVSVPEGLKRGAPGTEGCDGTVVVNTGVCPATHCGPAEPVTWCVECNDPGTARIACEQEFVDWSEVTEINGIRVSLVCSNKYKDACVDMCMAATCLNWIPTLGDGCHDKNGSEFWALLSSAWASCRGTGHVTEQPGLEEIKGCVETLMIGSCPDLPSDWADDIFD